MKSDTTASLAWAVTLAALVLGVAPSARADWQIGDYVVTEQPSNKRDPANGPPYKSNYEVLRPSSGSSGYPQVLCNTTFRGAGTSEGYVTADVSRELKEVAGAYMLPITLSVRTGVHTSAQANPGEPPNNNGDLTSQVQARGAAQVDATGAIGMARILDVIARRSYPFPVGVPPTFDELTRYNVNADDNANDPQDQRIKTFHGSRTLRAVIYAGTSASVTKTGTPTGNGHAWVEFYVRSM